MSESSHEFLYQGTVKKLHKRNHTKYQKRKLWFFADKVEYYKIDGTRPCGTISLYKVRVEIRPDGHFEFVYDDIKERQYVFCTNNDQLKCTMLWIANGEQFNNFGPTIRPLSALTFQYMVSMKHLPHIRDLVKRKYSMAHDYFGANCREPDVNVEPFSFGHYENPDSLAITKERQIKPQDSSTDSSSSDNGSSFTSSSCSRDLDNARPKSLQSIKKEIFASTKGVSSLELSEEDTQYLSFPELVGLSNNPSQSKETVPKHIQDYSTIRKQKSVHKRSRNITCNVNISNTELDIGSQEVDAIKVRISGDTDFIEIDLQDIGETFEQFKQRLSVELDVHLSEIVCIRKLPNIRIRNNNDIKRIKAGRSFEVEIGDI